MFEDLTVLNQILECERMLNEAQAVIDAARLAFPNEKRFLEELDRRQQKLNTLRWRVETAKSLYVNPN